MEINKCLDMKDLIFFIGYFTPRSYTQVIYTTVNRPRSSTCKPCHESGNRTLNITDYYRRHKCRYIIFLFK